MSDTQLEPNTNSKSKLIEVQHVGVTAKLHSPLKVTLPYSSSSTETDNDQILYKDKDKHKYNKLLPESTVDTDNTTEVSKILYEMRSVPNGYPKHADKATPSKIEFQLYNRTRKRRFKHNRQRKHRTYVYDKNRAQKHQHNVTESSIFQRFRQSLEALCKSKSEVPKNEVPQACIIDDIPEPRTQNKQQDFNIGIYPFEHGCANYLRTTDTQPQLISFSIAERATECATRFWAEVFGSLHIGVAFLVTFILQFYRFLLYSLINTLLVGLLHMTSDYFFKPLLTVIFNGFLQPPLIFVHNIFTSIRNIMEPIADTLNNFMKPIATVGNSLRLVNVTTNERKFFKEV